MFTPAKTVAYEGLVAMVAQQAMAGRSPMDGAVDVNVWLDCQIPVSWSKKKQAEALAHRLYPITKPDTDNVLKAIFDACNGVLWRDDVQVVNVCVAKRYAQTPCVRVKAWPLQA